MFDHRRAVLPQRPLDLVRVLGSVTPGELKTDYADAYFNLGQNLREQNKLHDAVTESAQAIVQQNELVVRAHFAPR